MKRRTGMKSRPERARTATRALSRDCFHAFVPFRKFMAFVKPGNSIATLGLLVVQPHCRLGDYMGQRSRALSLLRHSFARMRH